jgi:hypothetical protein
MNKSFRNVAIGIFVIFCGLAPLSNQAYADLMGETFDVAYRYPNGWTEYDRASFEPPTFVVGSGQETSGSIEGGVTTIDVDFTGTTLSIVLDTLLSNPAWNGATFNGLMFTLHPLNHYIATAQVGAGTTLAGFDDSRVTFTDDQIGINWQGLSYTDGSSVEIDFTFNPVPVPEPSTLALVVIGLANVFAFGRKTSGFTAPLR